MLDYWLNVEVPSMLSRKSANGVSTPKVTAPEPERKKRTLPPALRAHFWKPGQSGNPGGRTIEMAECQAIARDASPRAILRLVELIESDDERVALMAADKVLERAWGKPKEMFDDDAEALKRLSPEQRKAEVIRLLAYAATLRPEPDGEAPTDARHWSAAGETADTPPSAQS